MANEKILNTRIQLKYDSLANWNASTFKLKAGEIAIATLGETKDESTHASGQHPVLFKVGTGNHTFAELPFASALAADVYAWAKKENLEFADLPTIPVVDTETGKFVIDVEYTADGIIIHRANVVAADIADAPWLTSESKDYGKVTTDEGEIEADAIHDAFAIKGEGIVSTKAANDTVTISVDLSEYAKTADLPQIPDVTASGDGEVILSAEGHHVTGSHATHAAGSANSASTATISGYEATGEIKIPKIITNDAGHVTSISEETVSITIPAAVIDTNTAHSHSAGDGLKMTGNGGIDGDVKYELNLGLTLEDGNIVLHDKDSKAVVATLNAAELLEDSYLNDVEIVGNELQFTWKMDDGSTKTDKVDLTHLVDVYSGEDEGTVKVEVNEYKISAEVRANSLKNNHIADDAAIAETKLAQDVQDALALARTALQNVEHPDYTEEFNSKKDKQEAKSGTLAGAKVVASWAQDTNGVLSITDRDLTPADIGAQPAGNYKTIQEAVADVAVAGQYVSAVSQDTNGVITVSRTALPEDKDTTYTADEASLTLSADNEFSIKDKGITTAKIADKAIGAEQTKAYAATPGSDSEEVWVFYCGTSSILV